MRCEHCERLVILDAVKCTTCGAVWHKKCLAHVIAFCGSSIRRATVDSERRMSVFGVPLKGEQGHFWAVLGLLWQAPYDSSFALDCDALHKGIATYGRDRK